jgi:hypothetical protein
MLQEELSTINSDVGQEPDTDIPQEALEKETRDALRRMRDPPILPDNSTTLENLSTHHDPQE